MPSLQKRVRAVRPSSAWPRIAAGVLVLSMVLPWYQQSYVPEGKSAFVTDSLSAFGVFTFVEAAILLVAAGVLFLLWARMEGKAFHLPGGDGFVISLAGGWAAALLIWRVFDQPATTAASSRSASSGASSSRWPPRRRWSPPARACAPRTGPSRRTRPRTSTGRRAAPRPRRRASDRREPRDATAVTEALRDRPDWDGELPEAPGRGAAAASRTPTRRALDRLF